MEHELLVLALGYHLDVRSDGQSPTERTDSIGKLRQHLPLGEQNRVEKTAQLARKYGRVLAWARHERLTNASACCRILAARIDSILTQQVVKASKDKNAGVNDIYVVLWELETIVDHFDDLLVTIPQRLDLFVTQTLQDAITIDSAASSPLATAKYELFSDWISLQRNFLVSWLCYTRLPTHSTDFWIERVGENDSTSVLGTQNEKGSSLRSDQSWNIWKEYCVVQERLPSLLISETMASKVLFVGTAVAILVKAKKMTKANEIWLQSKVSEMFQVRTAEPTKHSSPRSGDSSSTILSLTSSSSSDMQAPQTHNSNLPATGGYKTFFGHWNGLEAMGKINEMADWAASALHKLVMVDSSFQSHLTVLCDYFFLQDGFFYRTLLSLASGLLELTPGINAEHDMNVFFQESAAAKQFLGETGDATSSLFQNLKLTFSPSYIDQSMLPSSSTSSKGSIGKVWRDLCLDYSTSWPLNLILSPPTLRQYNEIFQFLFHVKRIQIGLQNGWKLSKQPVDPAFIRIMHRFQMLRHQMGFFIDTLSQYLHVDVFSSEIQTLDSKIRNCNNFEDLLVAHQHFLSQVLLQCFLSVPAFKRAFAVLFDTIGSFTGLLRELASASQGDSTQNTSLKEQTELNLVTIQKLTEELETMMKEWFKHTSLLFTLLSGVKGQAPHLHHLLLLLDYSLFFSEEKSLLDLEKTHQDELPLATAHMALKHSIPISSQHGWVDTHASEQSLRSNPYKSQHSFRRLSPVPDSSDASTASSSAASSSRGTSSSSSHPKLSTAKRSRAASAEAPSVSEPPTKASSGPRPELLARLMRKSNK